MLLTDAILLDYKRCRRRAFLDIYGDPTEQNPPSDFLLKLQQKSRDHKQQILATVPHHSPHYPRTDWHAAAQATLKLMEQGTEYISGGVLLMPTGDGVTLLCFPDLLFWGFWTANSTSTVTTAFPGTPKRRRRHGAGSPTKRAAP